MLGILATYNVKGGVGKTTATVNLAWLAAHGGYRTLLRDLDPQGGATYCLDVLPSGRGRSRRSRRQRRRTGDLAARASGQLLTGQFGRPGLSPALGRNAGAPGLG